MLRTTAIGLSALLLSASITSPANAQGQPSATGSCGYRAGEYGISMLSPLDIRNPNRGAMNLGSIHVQVQYAGVSPGTQLMMIPSTGSSNLGPDLGATGSVRTFTAQGSTGEFSFSANQNENGATTLTRNRGIRTTKSKAGRNSTQPSASQSNGAALYYFQTWVDGTLIGTFTCGVEDRE